MGHESQRSIHQKLESIAVNYQKKLPAVLVSLREARESFFSAGTSAALKKIFNISHNLVAAGTFGLQEIQLAAADVAQFLNPLMHDVHPLDIHATEELQRLLARLELCLADPVREDAESVGATASLRKRIGDKSGNLVFVVDDDVDYAQALAHQVQHFGYDVLGITSLPELGQELAKQMPSAIVMDIAHPEGKMAGAEVIQALAKKLPPDVPVIFISMDDSLAANLAAIRAGGRAYFTKPFEVIDMIDCLDRLLDVSKPEPYRILIIEDSKDEADSYALMLESAGMLTFKLNDPMHVQAAMESFRPDLILMDIYMPGCTGMELATFIRQKSANVGLPIVYLSAETDLDVQMEAMRQGGDDFLTKPVGSTHLISSVTIRADRYRVLRAHMVRDSLTGLLNHNKILEQLDVEVLRAQRRQKPLSFAMLDIDFFKQVNDRYGHPVGDKVIKSLSRLLQQRLRKTDIIGRYGGEEFAIILPDSSGEDAFRVLDEVRQVFADITQYGAGQEFNVTFSAGVAHFGPGAQEFIPKLADDALYYAKHKGRNQVVLAQSSRAETQGGGA